MQAGNDQVTTKYRGEWRVDIALADGKVLQSLSFKIQ
jgi:hypothetical protein